MDTYDARSRQAYPIELHTGHSPARPCFSVAAASAGWQLTGQRKALPRFQLFESKPVAASAQTSAGKAAPLKAAGGLHKQHRKVLRSRTRAAQYKLCAEDEEWLNRSEAAPGPSGEGSACCRSPGGTGSLSFALA